jgi:NarL family two-component system response regulator LiaR
MTRRLLCEVRVILPLLLDKESLWRLLATGRAWLKAAHHARQQYSDCADFAMLKLMIVDDNPDMRRLIRSIVSDLADYIVECADGTQALHSYAAHKPDWVLMDIEMKPLDGISATREIKTAFPDAQIMIVTEYDDPDWREEARHAGACAYVLKENLADVRRTLQTFPRAL